MRGAIRSFDAGACCADIGPVISDSACPFGELRVVGDEFEFGGSRYPLAGLREAAVDVCLLEDGSGFVAIGPVD